MPKPPPPKPKHGITDRYTDWYEDADPPPSPGPRPTGERSMLHFHVPAEDTNVYLGYGSPTPGIRMFTDTHAHMTAETPLTTISLGAPGGDGIDEMESGLQTFSAGDKRERIKGSTVEWYENSKTENVAVRLTENYECPKTETVKGPWKEECKEDKEEIIKGVWKQTCKNAKTEIVEGTVTELYDAEHNLTVGQHARHEFNDGKFERVTGRMTSEVSENKDEFIGGNWNVTVAGRRKTNIALDQDELKLGSTASITVGASATVVGGLSMEHNVGAKVTLSLLEYSKAAIDTAKIDVRITKSNITVID